MLHIEHAESLAECKKMLMLAKAGKMNGCLIEGMGCPGGCVAGAGTILPIPQAVKEATSFFQECGRGEAALQGRLRKSLTSIYCIVKRHLLVESNFV